MSTGIVIRGPGSGAVQVPPCPKSLEGKPAAQDVWKKAVTLVQLRGEWDSIFEMQIEILANDYQLRENSLAHIKKNGPKVPGEGGRLIRNPAFQNLSLARDGIRKAQRALGIPEDADLLL